MKKANKKKTIFIVLFMLLVGLICILSFITFRMNNQPKRESSESKLEQEIKTLTDYFEINTEYKLLVVSPSESFARNESFPQLSAPDIRIFASEEEEIYKGFIFVSQDEALRMAEKLGSSSYVVSKTLMLRSGDEVMFRAQGDFMDTKE